MNKDYHINCNIYCDVLQPYLRPQRVLNLALLYRAIEFVSQELSEENQRHD